MDRILNADSQFSSVTAAEELWKHGLLFIGVINTVMWTFPMVYLSNIELQNQGDMSLLLTRPVDRTKPLLVAFFWRNQKRWYFL